MIYQMSLFKLFDLTKIVYHFPINSSSVTVGDIFSFTHDQLCISGHLHFHYPLLPALYHPHSYRYHCLLTHQSEGPDSSLTMSLLFGSHGPTATPLAFHHEQHVIFRANGLQPTLANRALLECLYFTWGCIGGGVRGFKVPYYR